MSDFNAQMANRVEAYYQGLMRRYVMYLEEVYYPDTDGKRLPVLTGELTERDQFLRLQEAQRKAFMGEQDVDAVMWLENRDGAQERYQELALKYGIEVPS